MRFESVFARAFGPFAGKTLELAPGMTVVYGPNEAGKSSWHAALFAGLCGRKRGRGAGSKEEQEFRERHRPWDGTKWEVGALLSLEDGRRVELKHDLEGKVACEARDADMWRDLSAEIMHEGSPDGAKFLGLDRRAFLATACVRQADLLGIREDSGLLQEHLQRAAATSGADATAAAALSRIDEFRREEIGLERANAVKPLQRAIKELEKREQALSEARAGRAAYLGLAEQVEILEGTANEARTQVRVLRARLALEEAEQWRSRAERAAALAARFPEGPPSGVAAADTLAQNVAAAVQAWQELPDFPSLTGESSEEIEAQVDALPLPPVGDTEPHSDLLEAAREYRTAAYALTQHDASRPRSVQRPLTGGASEQELRNLARELSIPQPQVDPAQQKRFERAQQWADTLAQKGHGGSRGVLAAGGVIATLGAALALAGLVIAGVLILVAGVALIVWATMRSGNAAQERALALEELNRAREALGATGHALEEARKRLEEAQSRASTLGVSVEPAALLRIADEMAAAALAERDLERWTAQRDGLAERAGRAEAALRTALGARDVDGGADLSGAVAAYEQACRERARTWREAARRPDLEKRLADRREKEQAAAEIARRRAAASERLREVADQCGVAGESVEALLEGLVQWRGQWAEEIREREQASREWVELEEKLNGRTLSALIEEAARHEEIAARLAEGLSPERLASIALEHDPRSQLERLSRANLNAVGALEQMRGRLKESRAGLVSVPEAEEAVAAGKAEVARLRDLDRILELTRTHLAAAQERVHRDIAPVLAQSVRRWLPRITKGRYVDVRVDPKTLNVYARTKEGNSRLASLLSHGTAEQIYLMLRVALAERLTKPGEVCPLVLDDVTVQADRERTIAVLEMLHEISKERQVILFTQEDDVKDWAERNLLEPRDRVERLVISQ